MSTTAFDGLARQYEKFRPAYPVAIYDDLLARTRARHPTAIVDAGCGTGINTRLMWDLLGSPNLTLTGIDVSDDMLAVAREAVPEAKFILASAEQMPLADASVDLIIAAQAIQWFDREKFYGEARRLLKPGGIIALLENNRDWASSPFLDAYEKLLESYSIKDDGSHYSRFYRDFPYEQELRQHFAGVGVIRRNWQRSMTTDEFIGMVYSSTQAQRIVKRYNEVFLETHLASLFQTYAEDGKVEVPYLTMLYTAHSE